MLKDNGTEEDTIVDHILEQTLVISKEHQAVDTVRSCLGPDGVFASGGLSTYSFEYWTRDMCFSHETIDSLGFADNVDRHIDKIISLSKDGQVPTLFFGRPRRLSSSAKFTDQIDNELLMLDLLRGRGRLDYREDLWKYVKSKIRRDGFVYGRDWRDGMNVYSNKATFHNQVLLYRICPVAKKEELNKRVNDVFWLPDRGYYADWVSRRWKKSAKLDVLGHALAILNDVIPRSRIESVIDNLERALTKYGYVNIVPRYPRSACGMWSLIPNNLYQNGGVWGLVQGHMILALLHLGMTDRAIDQFWAMTEWEGFHEWYHARTGQPKGSRNQLWTAALWLKCYAGLKRVCEGAGTGPETA